MPNFLSLFQNKQLATLQNREIANQLIQLNTVTEEYGLTLSKADCMDIAEFRFDALIESERIEIGTGAVGRIIKEFCDSGYVDQRNFRQIIEDLLECFYTIKNETEDKATDDQVMEFLHYLFENVIGGDTSKLYDSEELDIFVSKVRGDNRRYDDEPDDDTDNEENS